MPRRLKRSKVVAVPLVRQGTCIHQKKVEEDEMEMEARKEENERVKCCDGDRKEEHLLHVRRQTAWPEARHQGLGEHQGLDRGGHCCTKTALIL